MSSFCSTLLTCLETVKKVLMSLSFCPNYHSPFVLIITLDFKGGLHHLPLNPSWKLKLISVAQNSIFLMLGSKILHYRKLLRMKMKHKAKNNKMSGNKDFVEITGQMFVGNKALTLS